MLAADSEVWVRKESRARERNEGIILICSFKKARDMSRFGLMFLIKMRLRHTWHERKVQLCDVCESEFTHQRLHRTLLPSPHLAKVFLRLGRGRLEGVHPRLGIAILVDKHIPGAHSDLEGLAEALKDVLLDVGDTVLLADGLDFRGHALVRQH